MQPVEGSAAFRRALERTPLRFAFIDGVIEAVCPESDEPAWVLNIKRGILSALQNSMNSLDQGVATREVCNFVCFEQKKKTAIQVVFCDVELAEGLFVQVVRIISAELSVSDSLVVVNWYKRTWSSSPRTARRSPDQWRHLADSPHATFLFAGGFNAIITFWWVRVMVSLVVSVGVRVRVSKLLGSD